LRSVTHNAAILSRIHRYASCSNECFILALIYVDRLIQRNNFLLTELNVHRVVVTSVLLAAKFFDDAYYNNAYYAKVGGVLVSEMNGLEVDYLFRINFSLHATPEEFEKYRSELLSHSVIVVEPPTDCGGAIMNDYSCDSPPPAQVSPEVTSTAIPSSVSAAAIGMDDGTQVDAFRYKHNIVPPPPPSSVVCHPNFVVVNGQMVQQASVNVVPPDNMFYCEPASKHEIPPEELSYFGYPLQPHPLLPHNRRNSMPPVLRATSSPLYQPPSRVPPASDPIQSMRCSKQSHQPMNILPQFPSYNSIDASALLYSGNLVMIDHEKRIQQHLWGGTPVTVLHHHHHGTTSQPTNSSFVTAGVSTAVVGSGLLRG
jgi:Cyclin